MTGKYLSSPSPLLGVEINLGGVRGFVLRLHIPFPLKGSSAGRGAFVSPNKNSRRMARSLPPPRGFSFWEFCNQVT